jgi:hypothetical protein
MVYYDDPKRPHTAYIDSNYDGKIDITVEDTDRDGRWDISYHDVDHDGTFDFVGYHPDGRIMPSRYEKYGVTNWVHKHTKCPAGHVMEAGACIKR